jgi:transposase-like protein
MFSNLKELIESMPTDQQCREYLAKQRWADGKAICPYCGCGKCYVVAKGKRYKCSECRLLFSVTVGTVFEDSNVPLSKWFLAVYLIGSHKKGISSYQVAKDCGVSQKTGWFMLHRIREIMRDKREDIKLTNVVEVDETWCGGKVKNMNKERRAKLRTGNNGTAQNKTMVMGMIERGGKLKLIALGQEMGKNIMQPIVKANALPQANLITDSSTNYEGLNNDFASHEIVNHANDEYVRDGNIYTNTIEGAFSMLKRSLIGIYHQCTPIHLPRYCSETEYRYNTRKMKDPSRFAYLLQNCQGRLDYKTLTYKPTKEIKAALEIPHKANQVRPIIQVKDGELIATYNTIRQAAKAVGLATPTIWRVLKGQKRTAGGYEWYYA